MLFSLKFKRVVHVKLKYTLSYFYEHVINSLIRVKL